MEENKPKNSFFRKWAKRIALALGIGASTLSLGTSDAHAAGLVDDREDNNIKVETAVDNSEDIFWGLITRFFPTCIGW